MKKIRYLVFTGVPLLTACSGHFDADLGIKLSIENSGGTSSMAGSTSTGGKSSVDAGTTETGGMTAYGGSSAMAGTTSVGGMSTTGGTSSMAGTSSTGGSTSVGGTSSIGGSSSTGGTTTSLGGSSSTGGSTGTLMTTGGSTSAIGGTSSTGSTAIGGMTSVGGSSAGAGTTSVGGMSTTGGTSSMAGTSSTGGSTSTGGTSPIGGTGSTGGASATGGTVSTGGTTAAVQGVPGTGNSGCETMSTATLCPVVLEYIASISLVTNVTFWGGCGVSKTGLLGWRPVCTDVQCSSAGICICNTQVPSGLYLQTNADTGFGSAIGQRTGSDARAFCPTNYNAATGMCKGTEGVVIDGGFFVNTHLCDIADAVLNLQGSGDNYSVLITC